MLQWYQKGRDMPFRAYEEQKRFLQLFCDTVYNEITKAKHHKYRVRKVKKMKRVAVFLDGGNFFSTQKKLGWDVDTERLHNYCKGYGELVEAIYYTGATNDGK